MSMNCNGVEDEEEEEESEEEEDIDETSDEDEELDEVVGDEEEKVVDEEEADTGVGLKRKIGSASDETTKRSKVEPDGDDDDDVSIFSFFLNLGEIEISFILYRVELHSNISIYIS